MKRYMWTNFFIDTMKNIYFQADPETQAREREQMRELLIVEHGTKNIEEKLKRYFAFKPPDFTVVTEFHPMLREVQDAYVSGYLYASLTGACCLGERILNLLVLRLRDYYKSSISYKKVYKKDSFDNWDLCITTLKDWGILSSALAGTFDDLQELRHQSIHFQDLSDVEARAINALTHNGKPPPLAVRLEEVRPSRRAVLVDGLHQRTTTCELKETVIGE